MELKPGYKQTEVGVIPADWDVKKLKDVAEIRSGIAKNSKAAVAKPVEISYLRVANVQDGYLDLSDISTITLSRDDVNRYTVMPGDVLMNEGGDLDKLGRGAVWGGDLSPIVHQNHVFVVRCKKGILPEFLNAWTSGSASRRYFLVAGKQTTNLASINKSSLGGLPIAIPCPSEQQKIAEALNELDSLIQSLNELTAKKRDIKQAAMQELLTGKRRLPGFEGEWEVKKLREIAPLQRGFDLPTQLLRRGPYPVVYSNGIMNHHASSQVKGPGVVTGRSGTLGRVTFVETDFWPHNTSLWVTNFKDNDPKFVFYLYGYIDFGRFASGSGVPTLNRNDAHAFKVSVPRDIGEQVAIAAVLTELDDELIALEEKQSKTCALKQAMMQELITGRIRLR